MKTIRKNLSIEGMEENHLHPAYIYEDLSFAVLDTETLGLSPANAPCILCGIVLMEAGDIVSYQFLAEDIKVPDEEVAMLEALEEKLEGIQVLVTYNGRSFDVPYIEKRRSLLGLPRAKERYNFDLYTLIKGFSGIRKFLPNLKQKTIENYAGLWDKRTDEIDGKESISLFYEYLLTRNADTEQKILLHNSDDIAQLYRLLAILKSIDLDKASFMQGFPVAAGGALYITDTLKVSGEQLICRGSQYWQDKEYACFGYDKPSVNIRNKRFRISVPLTCHRGLKLADVQGLELALPESRVKSGFLIVSKDDEIMHANCNILVKSIIKKHLG